MEEKEYDHYLDDSKKVGILVEEEKEELDLNFQIAEAKRNPRDIRYWDNPSEDLIGKRVKKRFSNFGTYIGIIKSWRKPYFKVFYPADKDEEEMTLKDVLHHLDTDFLLERKENVEDLLSGEDNEMDFEIPGGHDNDDEDVDSVADSEESSRNDIGPVTVLSREQCKNNDVLKVQELLLAHLYDQSTSPIKFNKVNDGKEVNKVTALQIL